MFARRNIRQRDARRKYQEEEERSSRSENEEEEDSSAGKEEKYIVSSLPSNVGIVKQQSTQTSVKPFPQVMERCRLSCLDNDDNHLLHVIGKKSSTRKSATNTAQRSDSATSEAAVYSAPISIQPHKKFVYSPVEARTDSSSTPVVTNVMSQGSQHKFIAPLTDPSDSFCCPEEDSTTKDVVRLAKAQRERARALKAGQYIPLKMSGDMSKLNLMSKTSSSNFEIESTNLQDSDLDPVQRLRAHVGRLKRNVGGSGMPSGDLAADVFDDEDAFEMQQIRKGTKASSTHFDLQRNVIHSLLPQPTPVCPFRSLTELDEYPLSDEQKKQFSHENNLTSDSFIDHGVQGYRGQTNDDMFESSGTSVADKLNIQVKPVVRGNIGDAIDEITDEFRKLEVSYLENQDSKTAAAVAENNLVTKICELTDREKTLQEKLSFFEGLYELIEDFSDLLHEKQKSVDVADSALQELEASFCQKKFSTRHLDLLDGLRGFGVSLEDTETEEKTPEIDEFGRKRDVHSEAARKSRSLKREMSKGEVAKEALLQIRRDRRDFGDAAVEILNDVSEEFGDVARILDSKGLLWRFKHSYIDLYRNTYCSDSLFGILQFYVKIDLLWWDVLDLTKIKLRKDKMAHESFPNGTTVSPNLNLIGLKEGKDRQSGDGNSLQNAITDQMDQNNAHRIWRDVSFSQRSWHVAILKYLESDSDDSPDLMIMPKLIFEVVTPRVSHLITNCWDPLSIRQTEMIRKVINEIFIYREERWVPLIKGLIDAVTKRIEKAVTDFLWLPAVKYANLVDLQFKMLLLWRGCKLTNIVMLFENMWTLQTQQKIILEDILCKRMLPLIDINETSYFNPINKFLLSIPTSWSSNKAVKECLHLAHQMAVTRIRDVASSACHISSGTSIDVNQCAFDDNKKIVFQCIDLMSVYSQSEQMSHLQKTLERLSPQQQELI